MKHSDGKHDAKMGGKKLEHPHIAQCMKGHEKDMCDPPSSKVEKVMGEFKRGKLHSGSKHGPKVSSRKQAVAIAMSEAGMSRRKR